VEKFTFAFLALGLWRWPCMSLALAPLALFNIPATTS